MNKKKLKSSILTAVYAAVGVAALFYIYTLYFQPKKEEPKELSSISNGIELFCASKDGKGVQPSLYGEGWSDMEADGTWSLGGKSTLRIPVNGVDPQRGVEMRVKVAGFFSEARFKLFIGEEAASPVYEMEEAGEFVLHLTAADLLDGNLDLIFQVEDPARPSDLVEGSEDTRELGFMLESIALSQS